MNKTQIMLTDLKQFTKQSQKSTWRAGNQIVTYTRISDPSQLENTSLESQKKYAEQQANRKGFIIKRDFGGTVESAKTDERKEFKKMLEYVRNDKSIVAILVYSYERFSRSENAGYLTRELAKIGVKVLSVFQDIDVTTASGRLQQDIFYAFGNYDNVLRRDKTTKGMIENLRNGYWVGPCPFGYTNLNRKEKAKYHNYVINEDGELLRLGFKWKAEGKMNNLEIVNKMRGMGSSIQYKSFVRIISNPFYAGFITHGLIPGEMIQGQHHALISEALFLKANDVVMENPHKGIGKKFKNNELPLKSFAKDDLSETPFTGYIKKGHYYYKTRGSKTAVNERADVMNRLFMDELSKFSLEQKHVNKIEENVTKMLQEKLGDQMAAVTAKKKKITELSKNIESLELRYIKNEIDRALYEKYRAMFTEEKEQIGEEISKSDFDSSNLSMAVKKVINIARNPLQLWLKSDYDDRQRLQYLMFPEGIRYNKENKVVRTPRVNAVFSCVAAAARVVGDKKNGHSLQSDQNSRLVAGTGIEPVFAP